LRFAPIGGWDSRILPAKQVEIKSLDRQKVRGVIGASPPHIQTPRNRNRHLKVEDLFVDSVCVKRGVWIEALISVTGNPPSTLFRYGAEPHHGEGPDDRVGCAVLIRCLEHFHRIDLILR